MPKELKSIRAENLRKVAEYLGENPKTTSDKNFPRDLTHNTAAYDFVQSHQKYFLATNKKLLREFYEETGLILMNYIIAPVDDTSKKYMRYYLTMYGLMHENGGHYNLVRNNHITSEVHLDYPLDLEEDDYYEHDYDKDEKWGFTNEELETLHENPKLILTDEYEHCYHVGQRKNLVGSFGEKFEVKNGELFRDGRKIEEGVKTLFRLNDCNIYIIFEDNRVEYLEYHSNECELNLKYKKILYGTYFLATLKVKDNRELEVTLINRDEPNTSYALEFYNVDDIEFVANKDCYKNETGTLKIKTGKESIEFPIYEFQPLTREYSK